MSNAGKKGASQGKGMRAYNCWLPGWLRALHGRRERRKAKESLRAGEQPPPRNVPNSEFGNRWW